MSWDSDGIVKVGVTMRQRWRTFTLRGARLLGTWTVNAPYDLEDDVRSAMHKQSRRAFLDGASAVPFLGGRGDGWRECFLMRASDADALLARYASAYADA